MATKLSFDEEKKEIENIEDLVSRDIIDVEGNPYMVLGIGRFAFERLARKIDLENGTLGEVIFLQKKDVPTLAYLGKIPLGSYDKLFKNESKNYSI